jgi:regulatory protein
MGARKARPLDREALFQYALRALAGRAHAAGELREKLRRRAEHEEDLAGVLARLKEYGYLDDRRFAEAYSTSRLENQGLGRARVLSDLRKRRVAPGIAGQAVSQVYKNTDEVALIEAFLRRKFRSTPLERYLAEPTHLAAAGRRLRAAGFSGGNSLVVLKRFAKEPEQLDGLEEENNPD